MADSSKLLMFGGAAAAAYWWFYMRPQSTPVPVAAGGAPVVVTPDPNAVVGANTLAGIQARVLATAKAPAEGYGIDAWSWFVNNELSPLGKSVPDPMPIFAAAVPGFDRGQPISGAQYFAVMTPALKAATGLSGLGMFDWRRF